MFVKDTGKLKRQPHHLSLMKEIQILDMLEVQID